MSEVVLRTDEATALAHALMAQIARDAGIRLLAIKGPVANHYGLRRPRVSSDADVLVEPERHEDLCRLLEARGWHLRVGRDTPALLPQHSLTFIHGSWPCDVDVHRMFPGFFAEPDVVFDALWNSRATMPVAHIEMYAPSRAGAAVIGMLHAVRNPQLVRHREEAGHIQGVLRNEFTAAERSEFYRVAREGGAVWVLRDVISEERLGDVVADLTDDEKRRWSLFQAYVEDGSAVSWWIHLKESPWQDRIMQLGRALWVPRADVPRNDPAVLPTRAEAWRYQHLRWGRGMRALVRYFRTQHRRAQP
jgi:hypothetical protein